MKLFAIAVAALTGLSGTAFSGEIKCTLTGTVDSNFYSSGPFAGPVFGDTVTLSFVVATPGMDIAAGQLTNYAIDLSTFELDMNGPTGAMLAGPTNLQIQNDFPAADGFRINQSQLASGHFFSAGFGAGGGFFSSNDIEQLVGTYNAAANLTSFSYSIMGQGGAMEIFPDMLIIEEPSEGVPFCNPMNANSTGVPTVMTASLGTGVGSDLHLEASFGPPTQFGYFLIGTAVDDPGTPVSQGRFCLSLAAGQTFGRYNVNGTNLNSLGAFDMNGVLVNSVGTSLTGTGFDVPATLPFTGSPTIMAGNTWHFQLWHRENAGESNFSNGLSVTF